MIKMKKTPEQVCEYISHVNEIERNDPQTYSIQV